MTTNIDNNLVATNIFINLKKTFTTINHSILITKLCNYDVRGVSSNWIHNYLSHWHNMFYMMVFQSDYKTIIFGIPQGSIIGPLLFIWSINDLANVSDKLKVILFADYTNVFFSAGSKNQDKYKKCVKKDKFF